MTVTASTSIHKDPAQVIARVGIIGCSNISSIYLQNLQQAACLQVQASGELAGHVLEAMKKNPLGCPRKALVDVRKPYHPTRTTHQSNRNVVSPVVLNGTTC
jgi:hypothetical protein